MKRETIRIMTVAVNPKGGPKWLKYKPIEVRPVKGKP